MLTAPSFAFTLPPRYTSWRLLPLRLRGATRCCGSADIGDGAFASLICHGLPLHWRDAVAVPAAATFAQRFNGRRQR